MDKEAIRRVLTEARPIVERIHWTAQDRGDEDLAEDAEHVWEMLTDVLRGVKALLVVVYRTRALSPDTIEIRGFRTEEGLNQFLGSLNKADHEVLFAGAVTPEEEWE